MSRPSRWALGALAMLTFAPSRSAFAAAASSDCNAKNGDEATEMSDLFDLFQSRLGPPVP